MAEGFGELGGAGDIVERALWACARMREASGPETALADVFCSALGAPDLDSLFEGIKREGWVRRRRARAARARGGCARRRGVAAAARGAGEIAGRRGARASRAGWGWWTRSSSRVRRQRASRRVGATRPRRSPPVWPRARRVRRSSRCARAPLLGAGQARARSDRRDAVSLHMRCEIAAAAGCGGRHARGGRRPCRRTCRGRPRARARPRRAGRARDFRPRRDLRALPARGPLRALGEPGRTLALHHVSPAGRSLPSACPGRVAVGRDARDRGRAGVRRGARRAHRGAHERGALTARKCGLPCARHRGGRASSRSRPRRRSRRPWPRSRSSLGHPG